MPKKAFFLILITALLSTPIARAENTALFSTEELAINACHVHYSRHSFHQDAAGTGLLTITKTTPDKNILSGFIFLNSKFIPLCSFMVGETPIFEKEVELKSYNVLTIFLLGTPEAAVTIVIQPAQVPNPPPTITFTSSPPTISMGETCTLTWQTANASTVTINNGIGNVGLNGTHQVTPGQTTTYELTAVGPGGATMAETIVTVTYLPPRIQFAAHPASIFPGATATLSWSSEYADACVIEPGIGLVELSGSINVSPAQTTIYTLAATGPGGTVTVEAPVAVTVPSPILSLSAVPQTITAGQSAILTWNSANADTLWLEPGLGAVAPSGSLSVSPTQTTTYTITGSGPGGTTLEQTTVSVTDPPPTVIFSADPPAIQAGQGTTLSWSTTYAQTVEIDQNIGTVDLSGTRTISPGQTTTYTLTATGPGGTTTTQINVTVSYPPPAVTLQAQPAAITLGQSATLIWSSALATATVIDNGIGPVPANGSLTVSPTQNTTYTITATGPGGTAMAEAPITIQPPPLTVKITQPIESADMSRR